MCEKMNCGNINENVGKLIEVWENELMRGKINENAGKMSRCEKMNEWMGKWTKMCGKWDVWENGLMRGKKNENKKMSRCVRKCINAWKMNENVGKWTEVWENELIHRRIGW